MTTVLVHGGCILAGDAQLPEAVLRLDGPRIAALEMSGAGAADFEIDLAGGWLLPGFIDAQVNGGGGVLFNDQPTVAGIAAIAAAHARFGTTGFLPTLISDTPDAIAVALDAVEAAIDAGVPGVIGIHIEGPFINAARKGIHPESRIRRLDAGIVDLLCRPRRALVMVTLAPETADPADLDRLAAHGVLLSAGHTNATYEEAMVGFAHGVRGVTHLFNAMSPFRHRAPGMVGAALDDDDVWCGLIADGEHVAAPALRLALRVKGPERIMLVTDAMPSVGMDSRTFQFNGRTITVKDGKCTDEDGGLAGSGRDMASVLRTMVAQTSADVATASLMASGTPAAFLGLAHERGTLAPGHRADFVVLDAELRPVETWIGGARQPR